MNYDEWLKTVPKELTGDPLWKLEAWADPAELPKLLQTVPMP